MKRIITALTIALALIFGMTAMSHAFFNVLPKKSFSRAIDNALKKERWGHPDEALEYWQEALPKGEELMAALPDKAEYFMGTARCHYALGDYDKAVTLYNQALQIRTDLGDTNLNGDYPWVYVYLGLSHAKLGNRAEAVEAWEQVPMSIGTVYTTIQEQIAGLKGQQTAEAK